MDSVKIAVLGESGVGKSALTVRMITGRFLHQYDPTLEDEYHCEVGANGKKRPVSIMDTAGQESNNLEYYFNWADVLLVTFSLDSRSSLNYATHLLQFSSSSRPPAILVGTKQDLKAKREIPSNEIQSLADSLNLPYIETSAATNVNVSEAFVLATEIGLINKNQCDQIFSDSNLEDSGYLSSGSFKQQKPTGSKRFVKGLIQKWKNSRKERKLLDSIVYSG
jgi:small GTP-binding protein